MLTSLSLPLISTTLTATGALVLASSLRSIHLPVASAGSRSSRTAARRARKACEQGAKLNLYRKTDELSKLSFVGVSQGRL